MNTFFLIVLFLVAAGISGALGWFAAKFLATKNEQKRNSEIDGELFTLKERLQNREMQQMSLERTSEQWRLECEKAREQCALEHLSSATIKVRLEEQVRLMQEKDALIHELEKKFADTFKALSADALQNSNKSFLDLAQNVFSKFYDATNHQLEKKEQAFQELVLPIRESLNKFDGKINELEKARVGAYEGLSQQVRSMLETQKQLRGETANLVKALRTPGVRGRWGEIQLRRVVEMAGMINHCDFFEQQSNQTELGARRPDMIVKLPGQKHIVVDAKVPLSSYLEAIDTEDDEVKTLKMRDHAAQVRRHIQQLSQKSYWDQFQPAPEFVVLFLAGETFFSAALEQDPSLIEAGVAQRVIIATPTTLIALLRAVAFGWRQESIERNAQEISELGRELHKRLSTLGSHFGEVGKHLSGAVGAYNRAAATIESRVFVTARKFKDLEAADSDRDIDPLIAVEAIPRELPPEAIL